VNPAERAEPIEMPFGTWTQVASRSHVLDGSPDRSPDLPWEGEILRG